MLPIYHSYQPEDSKEHCSDLLHRLDRIGPDRLSPENAKVKKGEVFGIVGESGCGKSTLGRGVCKLENLTSGHVYLDGEDITEYNDRRMRSIRKKVQMVFQDPYASLNPRMSVFDIIAEPLLAIEFTKFIV